MTDLIGRDRKHKYHLLEGVGFMRMGTMWYKDRPEDAERFDNWHEAPETPCDRHSFGVDFNDPVFGPVVEIMHGKPFGNFANAFKENIDTHQWGFFALGKYTEEPVNGARPALLLTAHHANLKEMYAIRRELNNLIAVLERTPNPNAEQDAA